MNCIFINNSANGEGGAVYCYDESGLILFNSTFINNKAAETGGAVRYYGFYDRDVNYCTFINNAADKGGAIFALHNDFNIAYSIFDGNNASLGKDIYYDRNMGDLSFNNNYWSMNFTTVDEFINADLVYFEDLNQILLLIIGF